MTFAYGPERARYKRTDTSGSNTTTTLYVGSVEKVTRSGSLYEYKRYIAGGAALITEKHATTVENGVSTETETVTTQYLLKDHLGSVAVITNALGGVDQELSYDAWGQRRNAATWGDLTAMARMSFDNSRTRRGFTGHEMVDAVGIIHMNGRIYDPNLGRFMQADPVIQFPDFSQSHNRYSYVLNNPLAYTDPSGYFPVFTALAVAGLIAADIGSKIIIAAVIGTAVFADSLAQGVPLDKAFLAGVSAGALTAVALGTFPTGNFGLNLATAGHVATVATVGGITTALQGGKFGHGFLSAGIGASVGGIPALQGVSAGRVTARTMVSAVSAGTVSEITGGKFANGALTAAFFSLVSSAAQKINADVSTARKGPASQLDFASAKQELVDRGLLPQAIADDPSILVNNTDMAALAPVGVSEGHLRASDIKYVNSWERANALVASGQWRHVDGTHLGGKMHIYMSATRPGVSQWLSRIGVANLSGSQNLIETIHHEYLHYSGLESHVINPTRWRIRTMRDLGGWIYDY